MTLLHQPSTCRHCGQPIPGAPIALVRVINATAMPRRERQIADILLEDHPRLVSKRTLEQRVYDDEREDVPFPGDVIQSHISKLRKKLEGSGWTVGSTRFLGYAFREDPL